MSYNIIAHWMPSNLLPGGVVNATRVLGMLRMRSATETM